MEKRVENTGYEVHIKFNSQYVDFDDVMEQTAIDFGAYDVNGTYADFGQDFLKAQSFTDVAREIGYEADLMLVVVYDTPDYSGDYCKTFKIA